MQIGPDTRSLPHPNQPSPLLAGVAVARLDTATSVAHQTTHTYSVSAGTRRALIVAVTQEGSSLSAPTVTYGGESMTQVVDREVTGTFDGRVTAFFLDEAGIAAAGSTTITVTGAAADSTIHAASYQNVSQITPATTASAIATDSTPIELDIVTSASAVVVSVAVVGNPTTASWGSDLTEQTEQSASATTAGSLADAVVGAAQTTNCDCTWVSQNRAVTVALELEP